MKLSSKVLAGAALLSLSAASMALPVNGGISFVADDGLPFSFSTDTRTFDFYDDGPNAVVTQVSGDFASTFSTGDLAQFFDFNYGAGGSQDLWLSNGVTLTLNSISILAETDNVVALEGFGVLSDGVESVSGYWNLTANYAGGTFSWSSSAAAAVPEPAGLALMGLGLAALGLSRRGRKQSQD